MEITDITGIWTFESDFKHHLNFVYVAKPNIWIQFIVFDEHDNEPKHQPVIYHIEWDHEGYLYATLLGTDQAIKSQLSLQNGKLLLERDEHRFEFSRFTEPTPNLLTKLINRSYQKIEKYQHH